MKHIDAFLNTIPMYRLVLYGLSFLCVLSVALASFDVLHLDPVKMIVSLGAISTGAFLTEYFLSLAWKRPMNRESWFITSLILFFIIPVANAPLGIAIVFLAGMIASASKFLIAWRGKHILNPAAFAAALLSLLGIWSTSWWVGSQTLWWAALILGLLIIRKIRHVKLVALFAVIAISLELVRFMIDGQLTALNIQHMLLASPLIFLATIMLTEPATMPSRKIHQYIFAGGVGVLYALNLSIGPLEIYPEVALLLANIYAFIVSPKFSTRMTLQAIEPTASPNVMSFRFTPDLPFTFKPGQYMEWTLANIPFELHGDNRRMFTIASSPAEQSVLLGVKFYTPSSAYKKELHGMQRGDEIFASQLTGSFTLPKDKQKKLLFIAGGIGITPFRSMVKYLVDSKQPRDAILLYSVSREEEIAYKKVFDEAKAYGITTHLFASVRPEVANPAVSYESLTGEVIQHRVPDILERTVYISGPNAMVAAVKKELVHAGVARRVIKTDYFAGY